MFRKWIDVWSDTTTVVLPVCGLSRRAWKMNDFDLIAKHNKLKADKMRAIENGCLLNTTHLQMGLFESVLHFGIAMNRTESMGFKFKFELFDSQNIVWFPSKLLRTFQLIQSNIYFVVKVLFICKIRFKSLKVSV